MEGWASETFPDAEKFFNYHLKNAKFYDLNNDVVTIPKSLLIAIMYEESKGTIYHKDQYDWAVGIFGIRRATRNVQIDWSTGAVMETPGAGHLEDQSLHLADSIYSPLHNLEKYIHVFQLKYIDFQYSFNGANGTLNFNTLPKIEKFKFVLASILMGSGNIFKSYDRMITFNKAMMCNPCETFKKLGNSCRPIKTNCDSPVANRCAKTVPENFDVLIRFSNFTDHDESTNFKKHFFCSREELWPGEMGSDSIGPCTLGLHKSKVYRIIGAYQCSL